jgi:hypothetical protein
MMNPAGSGGATGTTAGTSAAAGQNSTSPMTGSSGGSATAAGRNGSGTAGSGASTAGASGGAGTRASGGSSAAGAGGMTAGAGGGSEGQAGSGTAGSAAGGCTRDLLKSTVDAFFSALAAHDASSLSLGASVKYTENGKTMTVGDGIWKTAGMVKFKRSALDTTICNSATESIVPESSTDRIFGLRLKLEGQKITEIETIVVRANDYILNNPMGLAATASDDWETVLAAADQPTRDQLMMLMDTYFTQFPNGACNFASDCTRVEDGGSVGGCTGLGVGCSMSGGTGTGGMKARLHVLDEAAGISVGFTMFAGSYTDFHLFKVRMGQVHGVHAVLAAATSSGWE